MKTLTQFFSVLVCMLLTCNMGFAQRVIVTLAGTGTSGYNGDGLAGSKTQIAGANDICKDAYNNIYFTDEANNRVRMISSRTGVVSTLASLTDPRYMCIDPLGNLYVTTASKVVCINTVSGITTTVAGTGTPGFGGDGGFATAALLNGPMGICIDGSGNLYVADANNNRIRRIDATTGIITSICGNGSVGYTGDGGSAVDATVNSPTAICVDQSGNIFFSDQVGIVVSYIREISAATGNIATIAGTGGGASGDGGPALSAGLGGIWGMCCDDTGNVVICDVSCSCREINMTTGIIFSVAGSLYADGYSGDGMDAVAGELNWPYGVFSDQTGSLLIADKNNYRIRKAIQLTNTPSFALGKGQTVYPCPGIAAPMSSTLAITDLDFGQMETWSVVTNPANGSLSGFPYSMLSSGTTSLTSPAGLQYTSLPGYTGPDSFQVMVSDGVLSDTITVFLKVQYPNPGIIGGTMSACAGASVALSETEAGGTWSMSNANATITSGTVVANYAGTDTVYYTHFDECFVTASAVFTIMPVPDPGIITGIDLANVGGTTHLSETVSGGTWSSISPAIATVNTSGVVSGLSLGTTIIEYRVTAEGCTSIASDPVTITADSITTSVAGFATSSGSKMIIAPNPVQGIANIQVVSEFNETLTLTLTNVMGEKVKAIQITTNQPIDELLDLPAGIYIATANGEHTLLSCKVVKE